MNILELLLGQIPEALYFALFMIYTKRLNEKRIWFIVLTVLEYILLFIPPLSIWSHILYFIFTYGILKWLYKNKAQITDIFTLGIASVPSVPDFTDLTAVGVDTQTPIIANANLIIKKIA